MRWHVYLITAILIGAFLWFASLYLRVYATPKSHGIILLVAPGVSSEVLSLLETTPCQDTRAGFYQPQSMAWLRSESSWDGSPPDREVIMTRLASGITTRRGFTGLGPQGTGLDTLVFAAQRMGRRVGLMSTDSMQHPGIFAFFERKQPDSPGQALITLLDSARVDIVIENHPDSVPRAQHEFNRDVLREASLQGYRVLQHEDQIAAVPTWATPRLFAIFKDPATRPTTERQLRLAIESLNPHGAGFLLIVYYHEVERALLANDHQAAGRALNELTDLIHLSRRYVGPKGLIVAISPYMLNKFLPPSSPSPEPALWFYGVEGWIESLTIHRSADGSVRAQVDLNQTPLHGDMGKDWVMWQHDFTRDPTRDPGWVMTWGASRFSSTGLISGANVHQWIMNQL